MQINPIFYMEYLTLPMLGHEYCMYIILISNIICLSLLALGWSIRNAETARGGEYVLEYEARRCVTWL